MENIRNYGGSDAYLLEQSAVLRTIFENETAVFTAFDTKMDAAFLTNWLNAENEALKFTDDATVVGEMVGKTQVVMDVARRGGLLWREVKYFVDKAFPNQPAKMQQFGLGSYDLARRTQPTLITFLHQLNNMCQKHKTELVDAGMPSAKITAVENLQIELQNANTDQEYFMKQRKVMSSQRIEKMNACYAYVSKVIEAAQIIFSEDAARRGRFVFYPGTETTKETVFSGKIESGNSATIPVTYKKDAIFTFQNSGTEPLAFFLSEDGTSNIGQVVELAGGKALTYTMEQMGPTGKFLVVRNLGGAEANYEVNIEE